MEKEVKIIGLTVNKQFGILQACNLTFDNNNRLITVKGGVGEGKTTLQKSLQLGTQGSKALIDKNLYGEIDTETQLLDGDMPVWVGCRSDKKGRLVYTIYTKDENGKIVKEPIIDGVKATPAKYLETLQTELTWRMNELTSENPTLQKKILLKLYQHKLKEVGVIFDKNHPDYKDTILGKLDKSEANREQYDMLRKQYGGIAEDLKAEGYDVHRPDTLPDRVDLKAIEDEIRELERKVAVADVTAKSEKEGELQKMKTEAAELNGKAIKYNADLKTQYDQVYSHRQKVVDKWKSEQVKRDYDIKESDNAHKILEKIGYKGAEVLFFINSLPKPEKDAPKNEVQKPLYIEIKHNQIAYTEETKSIKIVEEINELRRKYSRLFNKEIEINNTENQNKLIILNNHLTACKETNKICDAVDSFYDWQAANENVVRLRREYAKLLTKVNTGVEGLRIVPEESEKGKIDLYLTYDGSYDPAYFNNKQKEYRKLSSYSGTQKPVVCLLIQNYLLNQKPKSMRYMYIDNIPMDSKTIDLLRTMCYELNLRIFLNITGDYEQSKLNDGEFLIDGGEVFFN